ncbi:MAG: hypothetical protein ACJAYP_000772 [Flavobacterium sp.]|jgi:hypothetical protein
MTLFSLLKMLGLKSELDELLYLSKELDIDSLKPIVARKITSVLGYQISMWNNFTAPVLYRARKHNHLEGNIGEDGLHQFTSEKEFWNTPSEYCSLGRCQSENESLLYCSTSWETAISEIRPELDDYISISIYHAQPSIENPNAFLGSRIIPVGVKYLSKIERLEHMFENYDFNGRSLEFFELDNFLDELFHKNVDETNKYLYKLSVAVTKCMMTNLYDGEVERQMHGMIYSSMIRDKSDYNIVLRPNHARTIYNLHQVQTFHVDSVEAKKVSLKLKRNGMTIGVKQNRFDYFNIEWFNEDSGNVSEQIDLI